MRIVKKSGKSAHLHFLLRKVDILLGEAGGHLAKQILFNRRWTSSFIAIFSKYTSTKIK